MLSACKNIVGLAGGHPDTVAMKRYVAVSALIVLLLGFSNLVSGQSLGNAGTI